jgi:hypothetical protein
MRQGKKFSPTEENIDINIYTLSKGKAKQSQKENSSMKQIKLCYSTKVRCSILQTIRNLKNNMKITVGLITEVL